MSANRQRLKNAIRDIALTPEERRQLLGEGGNRGGKERSAGVGTSEAEESRLCCDGSTSSNANPGTTERDPDSDSQSGLDSSDPAKLSSGDGTLSGVTDCATGEPICFDGSGFIPPDGWEDGAPADPSWNEGFYATYSLSVSSTVVGSGTAPSLAQASAQLQSLMDQHCVGDVFWAEPDQCTSSGNIAGGSSGTGACFPGEESETRSYSYSLNCSACSGGESACDYTEDAPPTLESWPEDGCTNLAIIGGKIVGSKYDPENDGSYSAPRYSIDLCDPDNGARITLRASGQSDWKTIDAINGGDGYLYSGGKQIARVSGDEFTDPNV